jgi:hypothetical protein
VTDLLGWNGADFSPCRTWRYSLTRRWADGPAMLVVGLNPSTADEVVSDPTITRCIGFARREGLAGLTMANLFAYRATDPDDMKAAPDPVGPENDVWLEQLAACHDVRVAAWGVHGAYLNRAGDVLTRELLGPTVCFGTTMDGFPRHPLYLASNTPLVPYAR